MFAARTPEGVVFQAAVAGIPKGQTLDQAARSYAEILESSGSGSGITITSNVEISLKDGTRAYRSEIQWFYHPTNVHLMTQLVSAYKGDRMVQVTAHPQINPKRMTPIVESLMFH